MHQKSTWRIILRRVCGLFLAAPQFQQGERVVMRLAANTWCYRELTAEASIKRIACLGFRGVEMVAHAPCWHVDTLFTPQEVETVRGLLAEKELELVAISPATDYLQFDPEGQRQQIEHTNAMTDLAVKLGAPVSRIFSGGSVPEGRTWQECVDAAVRCLQVCAAHAEDSGILLAIESHGAFGCDLAALEAILEAVDSPNLGITLDTANFLVSGIDPVEATRRLAERIVHTHLKDAKRSQAGWECVALGEGDVDFNTIFSLLASSEYDGWHCVEYEGSEDPDVGLGKSLRCLKQWE